MYLINKSEIILSSTNKKIWVFFSYTVSELTRDIALYMKIRPGTAFSRNGERRHRILNSSVTLQPV